MDTNPPSNPSGGSLPAPTDAFAAHITSAAEYPARLGPYRVLGKLGSGGMGVVLAAIRDDDTMKKRVAIKLIKRGWDTDEIIRRFKIEQQVLGALNHPNIARVIDAGSADDGRPFFVMEFVDGMPIDKYCDFHRLTTEQRVRLFMKVCSAVQYAHQNLVVHRDIKPHNILVMQSGEPKLLDFGIAKLLNPDMQQIAVFTGLDLRLMTPEYASPEQVSGGPISTSSDVYSLGVLLYELLTGVRPYNFKTRIEEEIRRVVMEVEPARPSTAVTQELPSQPIPPSGTATPPSTTGTQFTGTLATRAQQRGTAVNTLRRELADDLDDIVLMAMRKVPRMRYTSAQQLADDLARHLNGEPVIARPESAIYRLKKVVKRHKFAVGIAAAFLVVSAASAVVMGTLWARAERQRVRAEGAELAAREALVDAEAGEKFATRMFDSVVPEVTRLSGALKAQELIGEALESMASERQGGRSKGLSLVRWRANAEELIAESEYSARGSRKGDPAAALKLLDSVIAARTQISRDPRSTPDDRHALILARLKRADVIASGLGRTDEGMQEYADIARDIDAMAPKDDDAREPSALIRAQVAALVSMGDMLLRQGRSDEAQRQFDRSLQLREALAARWPDDRFVQRDLSVGLVKQGRLGEARKDWASAAGFYERALKIRQRLLAQAPEEGQTRRDVIVVGESLVKVRIEQGAYAQARSDLASIRAEADKLAQEAPDNARAHWDVLRLAALRGRLEVADAKPADAVASLERDSRLLRRLDESFATDLPAAEAGAALQEQFGDALAALARRDEARAKYADALARFQRLAKAAPEHEDFGTSATRVQDKSGKISP